MRRNLLRFAFVCGVGGLLLSMSTAEGAIFSLRAVEINRGGNIINVAPPAGSGAGQELDPHSQQITALPNDIIKAEIRIFNFPEISNTSGYRGATVFQAALANRAGASSGGNPAGLILPSGWDAPITDTVIFCLSDLDCAFRPGLHCEGEVPPNNPGRCQGANHNPLGPNFFIDLARADFIHAGRATVQQFVAAPQLDFYGVVSVMDSGDPTPGPFNNPTNDYYAATIFYTVGQFACGQFTLGFSPVQEAQALSDYKGQPGVIPTTLPLIVNMSPCPPLIETETPPNCSIDARRPWTESEPATNPIPDAARQGIRNVQFCYDRDPATVVAGSFTTRRVPITAAVEPEVTSVTQLAGDCLQANLGGAIPIRAYTCIKQDGNTPAGIKSGIEKCWGFLPGDVSENGASDALDIEDGVFPPGAVSDDMIEWLRFGEVSAPNDLLRCDLDRSGSCTGLDVLTAVNMLNGSGTIGPGTDPGPGGNVYNGTGVWLDKTFIQSVQCPTPE